MFVAMLIQTQSKAFGRSLRMVYAVSTIQSAQSICKHTLTNMRSGITDAMTSLQCLNPFLNRLIKHIKLVEALLQEKDHVCIKNLEKSLWFLPQESCHLFNVQVGDPPD